MFHFQLSLQTMHHRPRPSFGCLFAATLALTGISQANDWTNWRGPLQNGVSLEHYTDAGKLADTPAWTYAARGRGTPVIFDGKVILWGYKGETSTSSSC
jgi:outer membrane protein assembly factor BamB